MYHVCDMLDPKLPSLAALTLNTERTDFTRSKNPLDGKLVPAPGEDGYERKIVFLAEGEAREEHTLHLTDDWRRKQKVEPGSKDPAHDYLVENIRTYADGACFFHSLAFLIPYPSIPGHGKYAPGRNTMANSKVTGFELRHIVLNHMLEDPYWWGGETQMDPEMRSGLLANLADDAHPGGKGLEKLLIHVYVELWRPFNKFAGQQEIESAAEVLNAFVIVISLNKTDKVTQEVLKESYSQARVQSIAWPGKRDENGKFVETGTRDEKTGEWSPKEGKDPDIHHESLSIEEARDLPVYLVLLSNVLNKSTGMRSAAAHYTPLYFNKNRRMLQKKAKEADLLGASTPELLSKYGGKATKECEAAHKRRAWIYEEIYRQMGMDKLSPEDQAHVMRAAAKKDPTLGMELERALRAGGLAVDLGKRSQPGSSGAGSSEEKRPCYRCQGRLLSEEQSAYLDTLPEQERVAILALDEYLGPSPVGRLLMGRIYGGDEE